MSGPVAGEVWEIVHQRKGPCTAKLLTDPAEEWIDVEIIAGKLRYASAENNLYQAMGERGVPGLAERLRTSFVTFVRKIAPAGEDSEEHRRIVFGELDQAVTNDHDMTQLTAAEIAEDLWLNSGAVEEAQIDIKELERRAAEWLQKMRKAS
jgi:hypothetical protein